MYKISLQSIGIFIKKKKKKITNMRLSVMQKSEEISEVFWTLGQHAVCAYQLNRCWKCTGYTKADLLGS